MIEGVGTDIIEVERIKKALKNKKFLNKVFTNNEIDYFNKNKNNPYTIAGYFASKEAVYKAISYEGIKINWQDIEINKLSNNKPYVKLLNQDKYFNEGFFIKNIKLSISHSKDNAIAFVIIER